MRRPIIAGNWKMNTTLQEAKALAAGVAAAAKGAAAEVVIIPPACFLAPALRAASGDVGVGAQNCSEHAKGAFTGELSVAMLSSLGVKYIVCGHSERRGIYGEDDALVGRKVAAVRAGGLTAILCVGETLAQRESGETEAVVTRQLLAGLGELSADDVVASVIAYEPVWAIGTGRTASPEQAQAVHAHLRGVLRERIGDHADQVRIQYGGSVKPSNAAELLGQPDIDGALVGGASLKADSFAGIIAAAG